MTILRVSNLDSTELDNEISNLLFPQFQSLLPNRIRSDEWKLLFDTILFISSQKRTINGTTTYGSRLSNMGYMAGPTAVYIVRVLSRYLRLKLDNFIGSSPGGRIWKLLLDMVDLLNFMRFLNVTSGNNVYYNVMERILRVKSISLINESKFMENSIINGLEYENRQLLWNGILELFNLCIIPHSVPYLHYFQRRNVLNVTNNKNNNKLHHNSQCSLCNEQTTNPYVIGCCQGVYCYLCLLKCLEWKRCSICSETRSLKGQPYYQKQERKSLESDTVLKQNT